MLTLQLRVSRGEIPSSILMCTDEDPTWITYDQYAAKLKNANAPVISYESGGNWRAKQPMHWAAVLCIVLASINVVGAILFNLAFLGGALFLCLMAVIIDLLAKRSL